MVPQQTWSIHETKYRWNAKHFRLVRFFGDLKINCRLFWSTAPWDGRSSAGHRSSSHTWNMEFATHWIYRLLCQSKVWVKFLLPRCSFSFSWLNGALVFHQSYDLYAVVTDLVRVWYRYSDKESIEREKKVSPSQLLMVLSSFLTFFSRTSYFLTAFSSCNSPFYLLPILPLPHLLSDPSSSHSTIFLSHSLTLYSTSQTYNPQLEVEHGRLVSMLRSYISSQRSDVTYESLLDTVRHCIFSFSFNFCNPYLNSLFFSHSPSASASSSLSPLYLSLPLSSSSLYTIHRNLRSSLWNSQRRLQRISSRGRSLPLLSVTG